VSLFVDLMGVSTEAIDALSHAGITISRRHLDREKTAIADNHSHRIAPNGISVHNPNLVNSNLICNFLDTYYMKRMSKTFNDQFYREVPLDKKLENMTLHKYDSRIQEQQEERKMKDTILLDFFELSLKNMDSYINALREVHKIPLLNNYLTNHVIPIVADWPGQVFTRQAITLHLLNRKDDIPDSILSFVPIIGVLHIQLNLLESILKTYWDFFNMEYKYIFSTNIALSKTPSPYRIFVLLELVRSAWKKIKPIVIDKFRKYYKNIEFLFLFELLDNTVPVGLDIYSTLFRSGDWELYIEGLSKIAKVVSARKDIIAFEDAFVVQKKSTYADEDNLTLLTKKASIVEGKEEKITYKLASLNLVVDKKQMPLGFSSEHLPSFDKCDH
ncbi:12911_t:CDS:2, partial [Racocetra persica]